MFEAYLTFTTCNDGSTFQHDCGEIVNVGIEILKTQKINCPKCKKVLFIVPQTTREIKAVEMECAHCIQERITEGNWDRFGTTIEEELKATCYRHLEEGIRLYRGHGVEEWDRIADMAEKELLDRLPCTCDGILPNPNCERHKQR